MAFMKLDVKFSSYIEFMYELIYFTRHCQPQQSPTMAALQCHSRNDQAEASESMPNPWIVPLRMGCTINHSKEYRN